MPKRHFLIVLLVCFGLFLFDSALKYLYIINLPSDHGLSVLGGLINFQFAKNFYMAFSLPLSAGLIVLIVPLIIIALIYYLSKNLHNGYIQWGIVLAVTGAVGNLLDRLFLGYVVDYIKLPFWPVFNLSDIMVVTGVALIIFEQFLNRQNA